MKDNNMNILYLHGWKHNDDVYKKSNKVKELEKLGNVFIIDLDYKDKNFIDLYNEILEKILAQKIDLLVGTSLGGFMAAHLGVKAGLPFVSINPSLNPEKNLKNRFKVNEDIYKSYPNFPDNDMGLILLDKDDELFDSEETLEKLKLKNFNNMKMFNGGSHRFDHMSESLDIIRLFKDIADVSYGF